MNKITTLTAIAMFAVIMGMSAFAPAALADQPKPGEETAVCHFDRDVNDDGDATTDDRAWEVLTPNNHGATHGHQNHGDDLIVLADPGAGETTEALCLDVNHADPDL